MAVDGGRGVGPKDPKVVGGTGPRNPVVSMAVGGGRGVGPKDPMVVTLAFTSGSASRADVGLDVAGMWRGCGRDAGGDVAWMLGAMWPAMCPPYRRLNGDFTRISNSHPRSNPL